MDRGTASKLHGLSEVLGQAFEVIKTVKPSLMSVAEIKPYGVGTYGVPALHGNSWVFSLMGPTMHAPKKVWFTSVFSTR